MLNEGKYCLLLEFGQIMTTKFLTLEFQVIRTKIANPIFQKTWVDMRQLMTCADEYLYSVIQ